VLMTFSVSITRLITHVNNESENICMKWNKIVKCNVMKTGEREESNGSSRKAYRRRYFLLDYNFLSNCASVPMCQHEMGG
jgi:hypothetical protein